MQHSQTLLEIVQHVERMLSYYISVRRLSSHTRLPAFATTYACKHVHNPETLFQLCCAMRLQGKHLDGCQSEHHLIILYTSTIEIKM